ncbi:MAG: M81 family metallopeptidase [Planctomycetes bacterium]|nr:M81 family metallopeptidase [Planctomycetota bacterium]
MRVGIISLIHESNTFLSTPTTLDLFRRDILLTGEGIRKLRAGGVHEISGFFKGLEKHCIEAVPMFYAATWPCGTITAKTCDALMEMLFAEVDRAGKVDGFLLAAHGANTGEGDKYRDLDGHWLTRLREKVGPSVPIIFVMDPHGNLSPKMVRAATAGIAYQTNPHLDQLDRGLEAADMMARTLRGEIHPTVAASFPPVAINIERQNTTEPHCHGLYGLAERMRHEPGVLSVNIVLGFPYSDVEEMGSSFMVVTDNDPVLAQRCTDELASFLVEHRHDFAGKYLNIKDAVDKALSLPGTVGLLDMGDNVGAGSAADGTMIAHELHKRAAAPVFVCLYDPECVDRAIAAGVGARVKLTMGGKTDDRHGQPLTAVVTVRGVHDGRFHESRVVHGGQSDYDIGQVVTVVTDTRLTIALTRRRVVPVSIGVVTCCGLNPADFKVIIAKGVQSPVPALQPFCTHLFRVNTPGVTCADMTQLSYRHRRKPLFPFEEVAAAR